MQIEVTTLDQGKAGSIELSPAVFEQPVRADILHQVVRWQLAKRRQGTHKTKTRGEIRGSTRNPGSAASSADRISGILLRSPYPSRCRVP